MADLKGLFEFFVFLTSRNLLPAFLVGLAVGGFVMFWVMRKIHPDLGKHRLEQLKSQNLELVGEIEQAKAEEKTQDEARVNIQVQADRLKQQLNRVTSKSLEWETAVSEAGGRLRLAEERQRELDREKVELEKRFTQWLNVGSKKRWGQPLGKDVAPFRPLSVRQVPVISVVNLKGGVGKTTLTANLGATYAAKGLRVLLIDLDYQGSLTSQCLTPAELGETRRADRFVQQVLRNGSFDRIEALASNLTPLTEFGAVDAFLLATDEDLDEIETQAQAHWLLSVSRDDVRFRLREALHAPEVIDNYDIVLIDCPPRLSTGCVNALAASDYALIPVLLDPLSVEAAPRLIRWLKKYQSTLCANLSILGVVGNRVNPRVELIQRELSQWTSLKKSCQQAWGRDVHFFDESFIRQFAELSHRLAALTDKYRPSFLDLADSITKELPSYARRRPATISPVAPAPAQSLRR